MRAGGVNERLKGERKARVEGGMSIGGGGRLIGSSSHILLGARNDEADEIVEM